METIAINAVNLLMLDEFCNMGTAMTSTDVFLMTLLMDRTRSASLAVNLFEILLFIYKLYHNMIVRVL